MNITKKILLEKIYLLPYILMAVSFLSVIMPYFGLNFDKNLWCNLGGYSLATDFLFLYVFTLNKKYCFTTRALPIAMIFVSVLNMTASFLPEYFLQYKYFFEVIVFAVTLFISLIAYINKKSNS